MGTDLIIGLSKIIDFKSHKCIVWCILWCILCLRPTTGSQFSEPFVFCLSDHCMIILSAVRQAHSNLCNCLKKLNVFNQKPSKSWNCLKKLKKLNFSKVLGSGMPWALRVCQDWVFWVFWDSFSILKVFDWKHLVFWDSYTISTSHRFKCCNCLNKPNVFNQKPSKSWNCPKKPKKTILTRSWALGCLGPWESVRIGFLGFFVTVSAFWRFLTENIEFFWQLHNFYLS